MESKEENLTFNLNKRGPQQQMAFRKSVSLSLGPRVSGVALNEHTILSLMKAFQVPTAQQSIPYFIKKDNLRQ
jgi:hypothetical protein